MIKKCDHPGCTKAGTCRAPKNRDLREYWFFCQAHAAEYNKNWNYYADMTADEIEADWERRTFGTSAADASAARRDADDYAKFISDFLTGRHTFDRTPSRRPAMPKTVTAAFETLQLPITASWREVGVKYRQLAKKYHPDTAADKKTADQEFARIGAAYTTLREYFKK